MLLVQLQKLISPQDNRSRMERSLTGFDQLLDSLSLRQSTQFVVATQEKGMCVKPIVTNNMALLGRSQRYTEMQSRLRL